MELEGNFRSDRDIKISVSKPEIMAEIEPLGRKGEDASNRPGIKSRLQYASKDKTHKEISSILQPTTNRMKQ